MPRLILLLLFGLASIFTNAQNITYTSLYNSSTFNNRSFTDQVVGSTPGKGGVSSVGAATYSIPISTPPGTNGVVPSVSVEYTSSSGNGMLGVGWSLSGMSAISRVPRSTYYDNSASAVEMTVNDRFSLDGQRLILKTGTNGAANSTYGTENENFTTVKANSAMGGGPQWFEVTTKDGVVMQYGNTA